MNREKMLALADKIENQLRVSDQVVLTNETPRLVLAALRASAAPEDELAEWKQAAGVEAGLRRELLARRLYTECPVCNTDSYKCDNCGGIGFVALSPDLRKAEPVAWRNIKYEDIRRELEDDGSEGQLAAWAILDACNKIIKRRLAPTTEVGDK